jgi:recombination protein RecT
MTAIAKQEAPKTIKSWITTMKPEIEKALPSVITPERFTRMALTAVSSNENLAKCTPKSFMASLMNAAQLGLEPNTPLGQAYIIPFKNKGVLEASFQIGYRGLIELAHRSGEFKMIDAHEVYENDTFEYAYGLEPVLKHIPKLNGRGDVIAYYGVFTLKNGGHGFIVMSKEDIQEHANTFSQSVKQGKRSPWDTNFDEMAKKTVLKKVLKYAPIKTEFKVHIAQDETIKRDLSSDMQSIEAEEINYSDIPNSEVIDIDMETGEIIPPEVEAIPKADKKEEKEPF